MRSQPMSCACKFQSDQEIPDSARTLTLTLALTLTLTLTQHQEKWTSEMQSPRHREPRLREISPTQAPSSEPAAPHSRISLAQRAPTIPTSVTPLSMVSPLNLPPHHSSTTTDSDASHLSAPPPSLLARRQIQTPVGWQPIRAETGDTTTRALVV
eukprot:TRINITY_DN1931_c0_g1_i18.p1 TRINITY_DN1931_c0_g1~~TRINITY_DN1931_c0_g1_i18.p1  ORF type:complete len:155 (+),score=14.38 TRINITY_DN1931_c0_g1_i18:603-1067(+)